MLPLYSSTGTLIWTFLAEDGSDVLRKWADEIRLPTRVRAQLDQKLDVLRQQPFEIVIHTNLLAGPIKKQRHIYKLRVNGEVALRPMLCRGPLRNETAYTLLIGAVERDKKLKPEDAPEQATRHRDLVIGNPLQRRKTYERFGTAALKGFS